MYQKFTGIFSRKCFSVQEIFETGIFQLSAKDGFMRFSEQISSWSGKPLRMIIAIEGIISIVFNVMKTIKQV